MKVLFILEYDLDNDAEVDVSKVLLDNIAIVSEEGVRPSQAHIVTELSALKVLSVVKAAQE